MQLVFPSLLAFVAFVAAQADPSISTPAAVVQCQPAQISFTATKTPVFISIIPGGQPSAAPLEDLGQQNASPFTWVANIAAGTSITFQIRDSAGAVAYSAPIDIQGSSNSGCLGAGASSSGGPGSSAPASSSSVAATSSAAESSSAAVTSSLEASTSSVVASVSSVISTATAPATTSRATASTSATRSAAATSASPTASSAPNSARSNAQVGFAGLLGLVAAAFMA